ncbi:MAG TPA: GFA family protein [Candidatus Paceibacterota bacterium]|nr:GFA family protein [Candidatus Paceibacterota bacterium]HMO82631.1 GFA family protein [Candidatus Paceibacterota bacterium]
MNTYKGSCLCGSVTYSFTAEINDYGYCHCRMCRKASGSAHSANVSIDNTTFKTEDPNQYIKEYVSSPGTHRFFCSNCGSPLFSQIEQTPGLVRIRLGSLDTFMDKKAGRHTFVKDKAPWHDITGGDCSV